MQALRDHYEGDAELDVRATKAQQVLNTLVYTNEKTMAFEAMITKLNKAYNALKRQGQDYTDKTKVEQLAASIKNPTHNIAITVAVENMREIHKNDYSAATQFITSRMAAINSAHINAPGNNNTRRVSQVSSQDLARTEWNGVDISDPWKKFTDDEWYTKLGDRGQEIVIAKRKPRGGSRNHGGYGYGGRGRGGRGRGGRRNWRGNRSGRGNNDNQSNNERNASEAASGDRASTAPVQAVGGNSNTSSSVSTVTSNSQASGGDRGGQNGSRFGSNRP